MGQLLKEVLKTLCGVNQWSYAVFWKIGCQNTKLLIWEECYYEPNSSAVIEKSQLPFEDWGKYWATNAQSQLRLQNGNSVQVLVNKMMMNNQVNLVGQGIVGRAAFTGNHEWILAKNYIADAHPPEVLGEIRDQFSGGMQTIAVIPTPHGVVQFGSSLTIMENMGFVNNVKGLVLQLGCVPGALLSDNLMKESTERIGVPVSFGMHDSMSVHLSRNKAMESSHLGANSGTSTSQPSHSEARHIQDNLQSTASAFCTLSLENTFPASCGPRSEPLVMPNMTPDCSFQGQLKNGAFEIPSSFNSSTFGHQSAIGQPGVSSNILTSLEQQVLPDTRPKKETKDDYLFQGFNKPSSRKDEYKSLEENFPGSFASGSQSINIASLNFENPSNQPLFGDDLYDILGADFKKQLFDSKLESSIVDEPITKSQGDRDTSKTFPFAQETNADLFSDCSFFTSMDCDHLLDAVVSRPKQSSGENVSCKTALTKTGGSSAPSVSPSYSLVGLPDHVQKEIPSCFEKLGFKTSSSLTSGCSKNDTGSCSQTTSVYGSQLSSWVSSTMRPESSGSTAYSKRTDEKGKHNRKRLKPGENPRPRPKDRQMIQDRVKELREIVPNGAKCSIDALLERTIKHMLFLQSVTKHADKLKQAGEPKIINKEGGLLLKDNFEGGATWAFEVGSQSMACPIIVEDLNSPRQMLVEMLCEEQGFFLEIADLIRGLGLTILKGVMEARNDKIWARFAVEANRDVTRMEVFMSLIHLMEQTVKGGGSNNMMVQHSFPQATSIPATGSLQ